MMNSPRSMTLGLKCCSACSLKRNGLLPGWRTTVLFHSSPKTLIKQEKLSSCLTRKSTAPCDQKWLVSSRKRRTSDSIQAPHHFRCHHSCRHTASSFTQASHPMSSTRHIHPVSDRGMHCSHFPQVTRFSPSVSGAAPFRTRSEVSLS